jgi:hypothetical protein
LNLQPTGKPRQKRRRLPGTPLLLAVIFPTESRNPGGKSAALNFGPIFHPVSSRQSQGSTIKEVEPSRL